MVITRGLVLRILAILLCLAPVVHASDDFKPISPDELALKDNPKQPGAAAMVLEFSEIHDDTKGEDTVYSRIKVFTQEGKSYGDIELPDVKGLFTVGNIKARTVHSDGTIVPFAGQPLVRTVAKAKGVRAEVKMIAIPDVQPGSIIEVTYTMKYSTGPCLTEWQIQGPLYIRKESFLLKSGQYTQCAFIAYGLPQGKDVEDRGNEFRLDLEDIPAYEIESYSLPPRETRWRVDFFNKTGRFLSTELYWRNYTNVSAMALDSFSAKKEDMLKSAVQSIVAPSDTPSIKLRKIYDKVQSLRNLSFERGKTRQEEKREKFRENKNVEDVWSNGYGDEMQLTLLFTALARTAGLDADPLTVVPRDVMFFHRQLPDARQFSTQAAQVRVDEKTIFVDPATPFCPLGLLPWPKTGATAMRFHDKTGELIHIADPDSKEAVIRRRAKLHYEDGAFKGTVEAVLSGQEALDVRLRFKQIDAAQQKSGLEDNLKSVLPADSKVTLTEILHLPDTYDPLTVRFDVELPAPNAVTGKRLLVPTAIFHSNDQNAFNREKREHAIYFSFPYQILDDLDIALPPGYTVEASPAPKQRRTAFGFFDGSSSMSNSVIHSQRRMAIFSYLLPASAYPEVKAFFQDLRGSEEEKIVLQSAK